MAGPTGRGPALEALGGEVVITTMLLRHVLGQGGVAAGLVGTAVSGDAGAFVEALQRGGGDPQVELFSNQRMGYGVVVSLELDVVIDVHAHLLPFGVFIARGSAGVSVPVCRRCRTGSGVNLGVF